MRRVVLGVSVGLVLPFLAVGAATAAAAPRGGPEFGQHVAEMAPDHPVDHGRDFGNCVSQLARTGHCEHHG